MARARDARLIGKVRRGDDSAFEQLHARYQSPILAFCAHLTGSREDAEDAVQHTFLACYRWIHRTDGPLDVRPWLFTVARNRCLSLLRARHDELTAGGEVADAAFDGLSAEVERRQDLRDLVRDLQRLPEPQRAALVLSQLDALSYREIGTVLDVPAQKVKALVFQARSSLTSAREAREAPCFEIREEIATARGAARRRRLLRRHVGECEGCREFEVAVMRQRHDLGLLLPVAPSAALGRTVLEAVDRETAAAGGAGAAAVGGGASAGLSGTLATIGLPSAAKLAVVAAIVGGGASGALAADLPQRVEGVAPWRAESGGGRVDGAGEAIQRGGTGVAVPVNGGGERAPRGDRRSDGREVASGDAPRGQQRGEAEDSASEGAGEQVKEDAPDAHGQESDALPPGLAKRDELPPGLAKRETLPPGLAKRDGQAPGKSGSAPGRSGQQGGKGNGNGPSGNGGQGGAGQGQGNGNGGGQGNGGGVGQGNGNAGNGNGGGNGSQGGGAQGNGGQGQGQGNGGGNGQGNGNGGGNGGGNPH